MKEIKLCCKQLGLRCPSAEKVGDTVYLRISAEDMDAYVVEKNGGLEIKLHLEQLRLLTTIVDDFDPIET